MGPIRPAPLGTRVEALIRNLLTSRHAIPLRPRKESRRKGCMTDYASRTLSGFSQTSLRAYSSPISGSSPSSSFLRNVL
jgi:hypothetical protein